MKMGMSLAALGLLLTLTLTPAVQAQTPKPPAGKMAPGKMTPGKMAPAGAMQSVSGPVKGSPSGKTFVIANRKGQTTIDASKASVRLLGRFASVSDIKGGSMVTATGTLSGTTLMAKTVEVKSVPGGKKSTDKMGKGKMGKMALPAGKM